MDPSCDGDVVTVRPTSGGAWVGGRAKKEKKTPAFKLKNSNS